MTGLHQKIINLGWRMEEIKEKAGNSELLALLKDIQGDLFKIIDSGEIYGGDKDVEA